MILLQKNVEVHAAKPFFWLLIRGSVDFVFYSRAGTIYLLKNIRKETQAFFQSITLRGMEDLQQNC